MSGIRTGVEQARRKVGVNGFVLIPPGASLINNKTAPKNGSFRDL